LRKRGAEDRDLGLIEVYKIITGKEATGLQLDRFLELAPSKVTRGTGISEKERNTRADIF